MLGLQSHFAGITWVLLTGPAKTTAAEGAKERIATIKMRNDLAIILVPPPMLFWPRNLNAIRPILCHFDRRK
jgi:hypothetical protein